MIPKIGNENISEQLSLSIKNNRVPHANLFVHTNGIGTLGFAIKYIADIFKKDLSDKDPLIIEKTINNILNFSHPDVHFIFPTAGDKSNSSSLFQEWKKFILENPFGELTDWYDFINVENKQGKIGIDDANYIKEIVNLHSYENSYKAFIIWHSEKLNEEASNKILKILEEENHKTIFILLTNNENDILPTIYSRTQKVRFSNLEKASIINFLIEKNVEKDIAEDIANKCDGNLNYALKELTNNNSDFDTFFIQWIRSTFKIKYNTQSIQDIFIKSSEFKKLGREKQKELLNHLCNIFRDAFLYSTEIKKAHYNIKDFNFENFSKNITVHNIEKIHNEIESSINKIQRNMSSEMVFSELSINIARFIHQNK